jgi:uncharacterized protein (UPF0332 family)
MAAFDPLYFLDFASDIATSNNSEVALRTCVGRAYYAIYLVARERLLYKGLVKRRDVIGKRPRRPHGAVIDALKRLDRAAQTTVGQQLGDLFELRVEADYHLQPSAQYRDWSNNWQMASAIAQNLRPKVQRI